MKLLILTWMWAWLGSICQAAPMHVLVDPGHGGKDHGVVRGTIREAQVSLAIGRKLAEKLNADPQFRASLTRDGDEFVPLTRRTDLATQLNADVLISIHANSNEDKRIKGPEFYFQSILPTDEYAQFLANRENTDMADTGAVKSSERLSTRDDVHNIVADLVHNHRVKQSALLVRALHRAWYPNGNHPHAIKQAPFYVVSQTQAISALLEIGYITNPGEAEQLSQGSYQEQLSERIYRALISFKETLDKSRERRLN